MANIIMPPMYINISTNRIYEALGGFFLRRLAHCTTMPTMKARGGMKTVNNDMMDRQFTARITTRRTRFSG
jgi:hypothetical protein